MNTPLSLQLRTATATAHENAEQSNFVAELMKGRACSSALTMPSVQLLVVYRALEEIISQHYADHPPIGKLVSRHYGIAKEGLTFYSFPGIEKLKVYKDEYRYRLDSLPATDAERERLVHRAIQSFELNQAVFIDLAAARGPQHVAAGVAA